MLEWLCSVSLYRIHGKCDMKRESAQVVHFFKNPKSLMHKIIFTTSNLTSRNFSEAHEGRIRDFISDLGDTKNWIKCFLRCLHVRNCTALASRLANP